MTDEAMALREAAHNLSGTDPQETQALMQMAANKIDELRSKLAEQKMIIFDYEMADYKGEAEMLRAKLAELEDGLNFEGRAYKAEAKLAELESQETVAWLSYSDQIGQGVWFTKDEAELNCGHDTEPMPLYTSAGAKDRNSTPTPSKSFAETNPT